MGILTPTCSVVNGTRLLVMSYTFLAEETPNMQSQTHVVLVQSNPNPSSVNNLTWSLVSAWERSLTTFEQDNQIGCHVDQLTGVFTVMSNGSSWNPEMNPPFSNKLSGKPGGFQYDPRTENWSYVSLSEEDPWGDDTPSYALFNWPNPERRTSELFQASIAPSNDTVNLFNLGKSSATSELYGHRILSWKLVSLDEDL